MPVTIIDRDSAVAHIGASFRRHRAGPERELIDWFLGQMPIAIPRGCGITVFCEPRLESGFPDLVAVVWNLRTTRTWNDARVEVSSYDLRLMHYLHQIGFCNHEHLSSVFGRRVSTSIDRLKAAKMIRRVGESWGARALSYSCAVRRLIAVEAKVNDWASALEPATLNTWFASESYVLVPRLPRGNRLLDAAKSLGIGIWTQTDEMNASHYTPREYLPRSYASWLFNEWAWRVARDLDEDCL